MKQTLPKSPAHVALIFEKPQSQELGGLIEYWNWSADLNISYLTIYDEQGYFKKIAQEKFAFGENVKVFVAGKPLGTTEEKERPKIGEIFVNFLSREDGKGAIVQTAKELASEVKEGKIKLDDFDLNLVDSRIRGLRFRFLF